MVPVTGLEPVRYRYRRILSPLRLPIPSHRRATLVLYNKAFKKSSGIFNKLFSNRFLYVILYSEPVKEVLL